MLILAVAFALAARPALESDAAAVFAGPSVDFVFAVPARDATIPTNARLLAFGFFDEEGDSTDDDVAFERIHADGARETLTSTPGPGTSLHGRAYLVELGALAAGDVVTVECSACFDTWTATVVDAVDDDPPVFQEGNKSRVAVTDMGEDVGYQVRACIPAPIDAAGGKVALRVITDVDAGLMPALHGGGIGGCALTEVDVAAFATGGARRFCFQTLAVDASGNESLFHEDICADLPEHAPEGCAQTTGAPVAIVGALVLLVSRRSLRRAP